MAVILAYGSPALGHLFPLVALLVATFPAGVPQGLPDTPNATVRQFVPQRRGPRSRVLRDHPRRDGHDGQGARPRSTGLRRPIRPRSGRGGATSRVGSLRRSVAGRQTQCAGATRKRSPRDGDDRRCATGGSRFRRDRRRCARSRSGRATHAAAARRSSRGMTTGQRCAVAGRVNYFGSVYFVRSPSDVSDEITRRGGSRLAI